MESLEVDRTTREFWNAAHARRDRILLSGSDPEAVLALHGLQRPSGQRFADIGYGRGGMKAFLETDNVVESFDIADIDGVHPISELPSMEPFDVGVCHLVVQHCKPEQVPTLVPPLKACGVFSVQFSESITPLTGEWSYSLDDIVELVGLPLLQDREMYVRKDLMWRFARFGAA